MHYTLTLDPGVVGRALDFVFLAPPNPPDRIESAIFVENLHFSDLTLPTDTPPGTPGAVLEPATWMLLASGFGLLGLALHRRRSPTRSQS